MRPFRPFSHFDKCRPEAASDGISGKFIRPIVHDKPVKFHDPCLKRSREIPPEIPKSSKGVFLTVISLQLPTGSIGNEVISGLAVDYVGVDVRVKFGDCRSRSNGFRDIRGADFVSKERTNISKPIT